MTRHRNHGLRKRCDCGRKNWSKCAHSWYLNFEWKDRHYRLSLDRHLGRDITSKTDAEGEAEKIRIAIRAGTFGAVALAIDTLTLGQLLATYERERLAVRPGGTQDNDTYRMNTITSAVLRLPTGESRRFEDWRIEDVTTASLEQFRTVRAVAQKVERKGRGARTIGGPGAVNRALSFLRAVFNWAIRAGYLERSPFKRDGVTLVKLTAEAKRTRRLQDGEDARLLAACGTHLRAVVECAIETGMRRGEILGLQWRDVALAACEIRLPATKTKTATGRTIPISSRLQAILALRTHDPDGEPYPATAYVFGNEIGQRVCDVKSAWLAACRRAAITGLRLHDLRREAGSRWLDGGVPLHTVRDWLGHTSVAQTSTYLATTANTSHDAMRRFEAHVQQRATDRRTAGRKTTRHAKKAHTNTPESTIGHGPH